MPEEDRPSRPQGSCDTVCEPGSGRTRGHTLTPVCEQKPGVVSHLFTALLLRPRSPLSTLITQGPPGPALTAGSTHSLAHSLSANYSSPEPGLLGKKAEPLPHQSVLAPSRTILLPARCSPGSSSPSLCRCQHTRLSLFRRDYLWLDEPSSTKVRYQHAREQGGELQQLPRGRKNRNLHKHFPQKKETK